MKIHITKKSGSAIYPTMTACGTKQKRSVDLRIKSTHSFKELTLDTNEVFEMICEKCLAIAKEQKRI